MADKKRRRNLIGTAPDYYSWREWHPLQRRRNPQEKAEPVSPVLKKYMKIADEAWRIGTWFSLPSMTWEEWHAGTRD